MSSKMDRYLGQLWAGPSITKSEGNKLRRKAQKGGSQQQQEHPKQRPHSVHYSSAKMSPEYKPHKTSLPFNLFGTSKSSNPKRSALPTPATPDDGKWLEDFRNSGYLCRESRSQRQQSESESTQSRRASVVPEFAHLAVSNENITPPPEKPTGPPITSAKPPAIRRYAKTPVSQIGQLESHTSLRTQGTAQSPPTVESIAESYRALLESRSSFMNDAPAIECSPIMENYSEPCTPQDPSLIPLPLEPVTELPEPPLTTGSPRSEDGTLVGEDSTDCTSVPLSSAPGTPSWTSYETPSSGRGLRSSISSRSPDLHACLDLLTKELSSAVHGSSDQSHTDTRALQVWVMIEVYEKLRDEVTGKSGRNARNGPLTAVFDTWLKALRSIHDEMVNGDGERSESDYGADEFGHQLRTM